MSSIYQEQGGFRCPIWLGGQVVARDPVPVTTLPRRFDVRTRTSNLGLRQDRPIIAPGMPNVVTRIEVSLAWRDLRESGLLEHLTTLASIGQPFDAIVFKQEADVYDGDGTTKTFLLQRRPVPHSFYAGFVALEEQPDYALKATRFSAPYSTIGATGTDLTTTYHTEASIVSGAPTGDQIWVATDGKALGNLTVCTVRVGTAPAAAHDVLRISYIPIMRMFVESDAGRTFQEAQQMARSFKLTEQ